ncbi:MAG: hypothetical protein HY422_03330 [Candidatus Komeilibacteria bacterium]|nr:hypothetical protein [Candidatus Komeilibacteria bacterium]
MDRKRLMLIILFFLSVVVFGWLLYYFFFKPTPGELPGVNQNSNGVLPTPVNGNIPVIGNQNIRPGLPGVGQTIDLNTPTDVARGGLTKVIDYGETTVQNFISTGSGAHYYDKQAALFFKLDGSVTTPLSDKKFFNVDTVTWSQGLDRAILEYPDGSNIVYDFKTGKQVTLPKELTEFSFDSSGNQIAAKWFGKTSDENYLMVGSADGSNFRLIEPLGERAHNVEVAYSPNNQMIAMVRRPTDADTQAVLPIGTQGQNFSEFRVSGLKFESKWSPTGTSLLYNVSSAESGYTPELWLTVGDSETLGTSHLDLQLNTRADKCTFNSAGTSLYCAEPTSLPRGSGLYPELMQGIPDSFYRIDLRSGQKIPLAIPVGSQDGYAAQSVFLSSDESQLYFVDETTGRLHAIRLQ